MADEAGAGAVDRNSSVSNYTIWSLVGSSATGDCTRMAFYGNVTTGNTAVHFAFYSRSANLMTRETDVITVTSDVGESVHEFTSADGDFTAFEVETGWYIGLHCASGQDFGTTGGSGIGYFSQDRTGGATWTPNYNTGYMDAFEADITTAGGSTITMMSDHYRRQRN